MLNPQKFLVLSHLGFLLPVPFFPVEAETIFFKGEAFEVIPWCSTGEKKGCVSECYLLEKACVKDS